MTHEGVALESTSGYASTRTMAAGGRKSKVVPEARREKVTLIPAFDPIEITPSYARIVDGHIKDLSDASDHTLETIAEGVPTPRLHDDRVTLPAADADTVGREMYASYLESDFPAALVLAERVLARAPDHALAAVVAERCRSIMRVDDASPLRVSSIVRVREAWDDLPVELDAVSVSVLRHVDGVSDAQTIAQSSGLQPTEALDRLSRLLDLGVLELVCA